MARPLFRSLILAFLFASTVAAQNTNIEALTGIDFNFTNPGARSLGMGGAFIALADDASAAEANPAGLTILTKNSFTVEMRRVPSTQRVPTSFSELSGIAYRDVENSDTELTFASLVVPVRSFTFAGFYATPLLQRNAFILPESNVQYFGRPTAGAPLTEVTLATCQAIVSTRPDDCDGYAVRAIDSTVDVKVRTFGVATAFKMGGFSIGASARHQQLKESAVAARPGNPDQPAFETRQVSDDSDITFGLGLQYLSPGSRWGIGAVAKQGGEFEAPVTLTIFNTPPATNTEALKFHAPDVIGVGIFVRPVSALTISADAVRVKYSNQADDFESFLAGLENTDFRSEDATELRVGAELAIRQMATPIFLRVGAWRDPAHGIFYRVPTTAAATPEQAADRRIGTVLFPEPEDANHVSAGVGIRIRNFDIDAGYDHANRGGATASLTLATRF